MPNLQTSYNWCIAKCNEPGIGYSLNYRNQQTVGGITYYDCSSFMWYTLLAGGFDVVSAYAYAMGYNYSGNAITTPYMERWLTYLGWVQEDIDGEWKPGDILLRHTHPGRVYGHTEMVYTGGIGSGVTMGAHGDADDGYTNLDDQVSINTWTTQASSYESLWRWEGSTPPTPPTPPVPTDRHKMPLMFYLRRIYPWL